MVLLSIKEGHRDDRTDNHASTDLWLDLEQKLYRSQILLITFEMCFNYVVKTFSSEFSLSFTLHLHKQLQHLCKVCNCKCSLNCAVSEEVQAFCKCISAQIPQNTWFAS